MKKEEINKLEQIWEKNLSGVANTLESLIFRLFTNHERSQAINGVLKNHWVQEKYIQKKFHLLPRLLDEQTPDFMNSISELTNVTQILGSKLEVHCGFGTALGLIREGAPIGWDFDFDLVVVSKESKYRPTVKQTKRILKKNGINTKRIRRQPELQLVGMKSRIDIFFAVPRLQNHDISIWPDSPGGYELKTLSPVTQMYFPRLGKYLPMPNNPEEYLSTAYGPDWKIPQQSWEWPFSMLGYEEHFSIFERIYFSNIVQYPAKNLRTLVGLIKSSIIGFLLKFVPQI
jgi:hypothetical protein